MPAPFTCNLRDPDGAEREIVYSTFAVEIAGSSHLVAIFQDLTGPRAASRAAVALAQTAAQLVGAGTTSDEILAGMARHAVDGTRALACGISVVGDDHKLASGVFGLFGVYLPSGVAGPSEAELAFYAALADQAAVVVTNARLTSHAGQAATSLERARLARELHDSVSQALFSMTMHARAAQLAMVKAGLDESGGLGRSVAELVELTRGALAEMRALIFELRPAALAEEGLVAALRKQAAALSAREQVALTVEGPEERLDLGVGVEEHLYRIASEAPAQRGQPRRGRDSDRPGHLGLSTMADDQANTPAPSLEAVGPNDGPVWRPPNVHDATDWLRQQIDQPGEKLASKTVITASSAAAPALPAP